jgi:putative tryptophan/tyrosine transport system substrate-binding protein
MKRREFITLLSSAAAWPLAAHAQQTGKLIRIGFVGPSLNNPQPIALYRAFLGRLRDLGFTEQQNLTADYRGLDEPRGPFVNAMELMRPHPELIVALGPEVALQAVVSASAFIPVVFVAVNFDPVARGYVASLARPGGNITGVVFQQLELAQKQVEILTQAFPERKRLAVLFDTQSIDQFNAAERAAKSLTLQIQPLKLENPPYDLDAAFRQVQAGAARAMLVLSSPLFIPHMPKVIEIATANRLPTMFINKDWVLAGGLMSYGADFTTMWRRGADYAGKILNGAKPADLPVEQATKFLLTVNLKVAKAIGVELPTSVLLRADEVIE